MATTSSRVDRREIDVAAGAVAHPQHDDPRRRLGREPERVGEVEVERDEGPGRAGGGSEHVSVGRPARTFVGDGVDVMSTVAEAVFQAAPKF